MKRTQAQRLMILRDSKETSALGHLLNEGHALAPAHALWY